MWLVWRRLQSPKLTTIVYCNCNYFTLHSFKMGYSNYLSAYTVLFFNQRYKENLQEVWLVEITATVSIILKPITFTRPPNWRTNKNDISFIHYQLQENVYKLVVWEDIKRQIVSKALMCRFNCFYHDMIRWRSEK